MIVVPDKVSLYQFKFYFKGHQDSQLGLVKIINVLNVLTKQEKETPSKFPGAFTLT